MPLTHLPTATTTVEGIALVARLKHPSRPLKLVLFDGKKERTYPILRIEPGEDPSYCLLVAQAIPAALTGVTRYEVRDDMRRLLFWCAMVETYRVQAGDELAVPVQIA